jgi:hypothetical protein
VDKNGSNLKALQMKVKKVTSTSNVEFWNLVEAPDGYLVCGTFHSPATGGKKMAFAGSIKKSALTLVAPSNYNNFYTIWNNSNYVAYIMDNYGTTNNYFNWVGIIGENFTSSTNSQNTPGSIVNCSIVPKLPSFTGSSGPLFNSTDITPNSNSYTRDYDNFSFYSLALENVSPTSYNVVLTGSAIWKTFSNSVSMNGVVEPASTNTFTTFPIGSLFFNASDILCAKYSVNTLNSNTAFINSDWTKTYIEMPVSPNTVLYNERTSPNSTRLQQTPALIDNRKANKFFYNTLSNNGIAIDFVNNNFDKLVVAGSYNFVNGESNGALNHIRENDNGLFIIDKLTGNKINTNNPFFIDHNSADDFKNKLIADLSVPKEYYFTSTSAETVPLNVREFTTLAESFVVEKIVIGSAPNYTISKKWSRDYGQSGDPNKIAGMDATKTVGGMCGFAAAICKDNGLIMIGNNDQADPNIDGDGDDYAILKISSDCASYVPYTNGYEPYQQPHNISITATFSSNTYISGTPIVIKTGVVATFNNCTFRFANTSEIYDYYSLPYNSIDADPHHAGSIGIIVEKGAKLILNNCTLSGLDVECITPFTNGNTWDGITVIGDESTAQTIVGGLDVNHGIVVLNNSEIKHARTGINVDAAWYGNAIEDHALTYYGDQNLLTNGTWKFHYAPRHTGGGAGGGIIRSTNSTFTDNYKDVCFMAYNKFKNKSFFTKTTFQKLSYFPEITSIDDDGDWLTGNEHVSMWMNHDIKYWGCKFKGKEVNNFYPMKRTSGIASGASEFTVDRICDSYDIWGNCTSWAPSSFSNLAIGISTSPSACLPASAPMIVRSTWFGMNNGLITDPNIQNVSYNGGEFNCIINNNDMAISNKEQNGGTGVNILNGVTMDDYVTPIYPFGIHMQGTMHITCEDNRIIGQGPIINSNTGEERANFGIIINDCPYNNEVYKNTVNDVNYALTSLYLCWTNPWINPTPNGLETGASGLMWHCNDMQTNNLLGIDVTNNSVVDATNNNTGTPLDVSNHRYFQGNPFVNDKLQKANNRFYLACNNASNDDRLRTFNDPSNIGYIYSAIQNASIPEFDPLPCISPQIVVSYQFNNEDFNTVCPNHYDYSGKTVKWTHDQFPVHATKLQALTAQKSIIDNLIAMGDDQQLLSYISNPSIGSSLLKQYLLAAGPYLSDRVINAVIARGATGITNADLRDIVVANSPLPEPLYDYLDGTRPIVAGNNTVIQAQLSEASPRTKMQVNSDYLQAQTDITINKAIESKNSVDEDANEEVDNASIAALLLLNNKTLDAIPYLWRIGNYTDANTLLTNFVPQGQEETDRKAYLELLKQNVQNNATIPSLLASNAELLGNIQTHHTTSAYNIATLKYVNGIGNKPNPIIPRRTISANKTSTKSTKKKYVITNYLDFGSENSALFFPNPVCNSLYLNFMLDKKTIKAEVKIMDFTGKVILAEMLNIKENRKSFDISALANGIYTAQVFADDKSFYIQKITITK